MEIQRNHEGALKWACVGAVVIAMECIGRESLTTHARRALEHPVGRFAIPLAIGVTALHLLDRLDERIDPYEIIGSTIERWRHGTT